MSEPARKLLAAANKGTEIITRDSDGAVFIRLDAAEGVVARLEASLLAAAEQFARYADYHLAKVPPDREKAATNVEWATRCREVVRADAAALADAPGENL